MNTQQKIAFLLADYAVRVIAARFVPELAELTPIRSLETASAAYIYINNSVTYTNNHASAYTRFYAARAADNAANVIRIADNAIYYAIRVTNTTITAANTTITAADTSDIGNHYIIDMRELINIAIDPDRYW